MSHKVNGILFFFILLMGLLLLFANKPQEISLDEKRRLAVLPRFTLAAYFRGTWADSIDQYINDQFPERNFLLRLAGRMRSFRGMERLNEEKIVVVRKPGQVPGRVEEDYNESLQADSLSSNQVASENKISADSIPLIQVDFDEYFWRSLLIWNGRVFPLQGGSPRAAVGFARMISEYAARLKGKTRVFSAVPPLSSAFIPDEKYRRFHALNQKTLEGIRDNLSNGAIFCDVFSELNNHVNERLYFGSDHHWTARGAYYGYTAFCKAAGFEPVPRGDMNHRIRNKFLGSFYQLIKDKTIREHPDTFEYFIPKISSSALRFGAADFRGVKSSVFCHGCSGGNSYSTFICGDNPLMRIKTANKNGRKAMVIKNSMGNAFTVFLISHYEEVWVMDFRYSKHNLSDILEKYQINDLIFSIGMHSAMSSGTIRMMRNLAFQKGAPPAPAPPPVPKDSSARLSLPFLLKDSLK